MSQAIRVHLGERSYDIVVTSDDLTGVGAFARERARGTACLVVSDANTTRYAASVTRSLRSAGFRVENATMTPGEEQKSLNSASSLYDRLVEMTADRQTLIVAVGGGVIGDLAGFVAATFARGLPLLMVPTTLLAMVDSSVGGKVGVNHPKGKNLIGAFHQPVGVWIDTSTLDTLPDREYRSGLAEVVKYGVILDPELFAYLETKVAAILARDSEAVRHIVARCCRLKADIVEQDERETTGLRAILNYGHTFAHAFETIGGYSHWLHGEAVAVGMICASRLAEQLGLIDAAATQRQRLLLERFSLPTRRLAWPTAVILSVMRRDKKTLGGRLRLVLPRKLGDASLFNDISEVDVSSVLDEDINATEDMVIGE